MMSVPATITSYLPTLLASVSSNAAPDDSTLSTSAQGQVDYLSHEWREEDVWQSWRNMTRQKNAIANGMRLENASWRTWWKQRNKLKTISPETLNWLKDSDVTWLYGPLHVGSDWIKVAEQHPNRVRKTSFSGESSRSGLLSQTASPNLVGKKPILKRRSISQLLSLPASPFFDQEDSEENDDEEAEPEPLRPALLHTKSDTHISWRSRPYRKDSPPRITAAELQQQHPPSGPHPPEGDALGLRTMTTSSDASNSTGSEQDLSAGSSTGAESGGKKKHISFNTFVEQCIAIEKPKSKRKKSFVGSRPGRLGFFPNSGYDDGYDEDSEGGYEYESDEPSSFYVGDRAGMGSDSEDEDEDVLEMRTSSSRSRSSSSSRSRQSPLAGADAHDPRSTSPQSSAAAMRARPPLVRQGSADRDRVTIAPIAPTILKTIGVGNNLTSISEGRARTPKEVELVYVPPSNSIYSLPSTPNMGPEDIYHHQESYFSIGGPSSTMPSRHSPLVHNAYLAGPSQSPYDQSPSGSTSRHYPTSPHHSAFAHHSHHSFVDSPQMMDDPSANPDAYDYFGGPDLGEDFERNERRQHARRSRSYSDAGNDDLVGLHDGSGMLRYAHGGAASVTSGRSSGEGSSSHGQDHIWPGVVGAQVGSSTSPLMHGNSEVPSVIVNEATGAMEERTERSPMSTSPVSASPPTAPTAMPIAIKTTPVHEIPGPAFGHSPSNPSAVARMMAHGVSSSYPRRQDSDPSYLSPPDASGSARGRSPQRSSHSGSTTTGSYSHSSDSRSESRGRSSTRTSSFSDHERSGSRGSRGTNSPMGSISPTGSSAAVAVGYVAGRGRERESRVIRRGGGSDGSVSVGEEERRGRDRSGRKLGESMSPPSLMGSPARNPSDLGDYQPYTPELLGAHLEKMDKEKKDKEKEKTSTTTSPPSSVSGSSTASSTTVGPNDVSDVRTVSGKRPSVVSIPIPSPIPEADEDALRSNPTPANSPITTLSLQPKSLPVPVPAVLQTPTSPPPQFSRAPKAPLVLPVTSPSEATATTTTSPPLSPTHLQRSSEKAVKGASSDEGQQSGTLVGRAAEIVSSARGLLGSLWSTSNSASSGA